MGFKEVTEDMRYSRFGSLLSLVLVMLLLGTLFYHFLEGWRLLDALYFSVISLTTVGYQEIYPLSDIGRIFTIFYLLLGIGIFIAFINVIAREAATARVAKKTLTKKIQREERRKIKKSLNKKLK